MRPFAWGMRASLLVAFVAGVVAGAAGAWWLHGGEAPPPRWPRESVRTAPVSSGRTRVAPSSVPAPSPAASRSEEEPETAPAVPEAPVREPAEPGFLVVDCGGSGIDVDTVRVTGLTILGETAEADVLPGGESGLLRYRLWPGRYTAEWEEADGARRVGVTVRETETTTVRVADPRRPGEDPLRPGFGRLEVRVFDLEHRPLPDAYLALFGYAVDRLEEVDLETGQSGSCLVDVRPGAYVLRLGGQEREARVAAGRTELVEFRYRDEGEIEVRMAGLGGATPEVHPLDLREVVESYAMFRMEPEGIRLHYVPSGEWELSLRFANESAPRRLGRVRVAPRRRTTVTPELPTGRIEVALRAGARLARLVQLRVQADRLDETGLPRRAWADAVLAPTADGSGSARTWFGWLSPGRYRLSCAPAGFRPWAGEVEVGAEPAQVSIVLERE